MPDLKLIPNAVLSLILALACLAQPASAQPASAQPDPDRTATVETDTDQMASHQTPEAALAEGNRLFAAGELEQAARIYEAGYSSQQPHPTLIYNLATTLHHLDRLPEAILWYRRASTADDPWLEENLWLARRSLGSQILPPAGILGWLAQRPQLVWWFALAGTWAALVLCIAGRRSPAWLRGSAVLIALGCYAAGFMVVHKGPQPAVLLQDCTTAIGDLPAGTEAWVQADGAEWWKISGVEARCPHDSAAIVQP